MGTPSDQIPQEKVNAPQPNVNTLGGALKTDMQAPQFAMPKTPRQAFERGAALAPMQAQAGADYERAKMENENAIVAARAQGSEQAYTNLKSKVDEERAKEAEYPYPEFHPTQDNAASLGGLFSMIATMGVMLGNSGKFSATNAMNAMSGMMKGWQSGRKDLYEKEYKEYKTNFDRIKQIREDLRKDLEDYYKLAPYDKEAAQGKLEMIARKAGTNSIIGAYANKAQVDKIVDFYEKSGNFLQKEEELVLRRRQASAANYQYFNKDGKTFAINTKMNPNEPGAIQEVPFDLSGATKLGAGKGDAFPKKGEFQAAFISNAIGRKVDVDIGSKMAATVRYMSKLDDLGEKSRGLGTKSGFAAEVAGFVNKFVSTDLDKYAETDPKTGEKIITQESLQKAIDDTERSKTFVGFSENAKELSKAQLDTVMAYLQSKYGNRAPVIEFKAASNALTRENMDAVTFERVLQHEKQSSIELIASLGFNNDDYNKVRTAIKANEQGFEKTMKPDVGAVPVNTVGGANLPEGIPAGSTYLGKADDGTDRDVYQTPSGKKLAVKSSWD